MSILRDFRYGRWECGVGWWPGSARWFTCGRDWMDGWWYGFRLGPFWLACSPA